MNITLNKTISAVDGKSRITLKPGTYAAPGDLSGKLAKELIRRGHAVAGGARDSDVQSVDLKQGEGEGEGEGEDEDERDGEGEGEGEGGEI